MDTTHDPFCGRYCDGKPPKCRGGDCTLCDEVDCTCDLIRQAEQRGREMERAERIACTCDTNPHTMDGPSEYCPQHGRPYVEAYDGGYRAGRADERKAAAERVAGIGIGLGDPYGKGWNLARTAAIAAALGEGE